MPKAGRKSPLDSHLAIFDHLEFVADAYPSFAAHFPALEALGLDPVQDATRLRALVAEARRAHVDASIAEAYLRAADEKAGELAGKTMTWVRTVRLHLRAAEANGDDAAEAVAEVRAMLTLRKAHFPSALALVRRVVPALAVHADVLDVHPAAAQVRANGERLRTALEEVEAEIARRVRELDDAVEASDATVRTAVVHHDAMKRGWDIAHLATPGHPRWPFGKRPHLRLRDGRRKRTRRPRLTLVRQG